MVTRDRQGAGPWVVAVGGLIASGKSTVAGRIANQLSAEVVSADETRQELFERGARGAYAPGFSKTVYPELFRQARATLESGKSVVLDGTFRSRSLRAAARKLAVDHHVPFRFVECRAGAATCRDRLSKREESEGHRGWLALFESFLNLWEPVDELPEEEHVVLDTSLPPHALRAIELDLEACAAAS